jgi:putative transposase
MGKVAKKATGMKSVVKVDEAEVRAHVDTVVRDTVEAALNGMLEAEADRLCRAKRYERSPERTDTRAGRYDRCLQTKAGDVTLHVPV